MKPIAFISAMLVGIAAADAAVVANNVRPDSGKTFAQTIGNDPSAFGFDTLNLDVTVIDFENFSTGTFASDALAALGIRSITGATLRDNVWRGASSGTNALYTRDSILIEFDQAVSQVGFINTSPDRDWAAVFDSNFNEIGSVNRNQSNQNGNYDRFVSFDTGGPDDIGFVLIQNVNGGLEIDDLTFARSKFGGQSPFGASADASVATPIGPAGGLFATAIAAFFLRQRISGS